MSTVDKMLIKGIRSFAPDNQNVIEFYKPLTLIVGHNGAGKTTIIECLKQACTGELPPNCSKGQSFIHDPKAAGETEVKGQIKLRIRTAAGSPVVICRSFQLTQKKASLQFKTLDQSIQTSNKDTGQKESMSYRCTDIDRIVPSLLGVSKAILENVIFVHQEESNWPLSDGQTLKKKFDDIFAATKYTKALEALRKLRTEKGQEVKEFKLKLEHLKTLLDSALRLRSDVKEGQGQDADLTVKISGLEERIKDMVEVDRALARHLEVITSKMDELTKLKTQLDMMTKHNAETFTRLESKYGKVDVELSMAELQDWQQEVEDSVGKVRQAVAELERQLNATRMSTEAIKEEYTKALKLQGRLSGEAAMNEQNVRERDRLVRTIAAQTGIIRLEGEGPLAPEAVSGMTGALEQQLRGRQQALAGAKAANRAADEELGRAIDAATGGLSATQANIRVKEEQLRKNEADINQRRAETQTCMVGRAMLENVTEREAAARAALESKQQAEAAADLPGTLQRHSRALDDMQRQGAELRQERDRLSAAQEATSQLKYKTQELLQKEEQISTLLSSRQGKLEHLLGVRGAGLPPTAQLKAAVERALAARQADAAEKAEQVREAQARQAAGEGAATTLRTQLHGQQAELERVRGELQRGLARVYQQEAHEESRLAALTEKEEEVRTTELKNLQKVDAMEINVRQYKVIAAQKHECPTCGTKLADQRALQAFNARQDDMLTRLPATRSKLTAVLERTEARLQALKALQPAFVRYETLAAREVPGLQRRLAEAEGAARAAAAALEELQAEKLMQEVEVQEAQKLAQEVVWPVDRLAGEAAALRGEVERLRAQMAALHGRRSLEDVGADLDALESQRQAQERARDEVLRRQNKLRDEVTALTAQWQKVREEKLQTLHLAERRSALETQIRAIDAASERLRAEVAELRASCAPLEEQRQQLHRQREAKRKENVEREGELDAAIRELQRFASELASRCRPVEEYAAADKARELQNVTARMQRLQQQIVDNEQKIADTHKRLEAKTKESQGVEKLRHEVEDTLDLARQRAEEEELARRVNELTVECAEAGQFEELEAQRAELAGGLQRLRSERDVLRGKAAQVRQGVARAQEELGKPQYRGVDARYRSQQIELRTTEMANSDLDKYHKALEKALLAFHTTKMGDINKIVKEMWQKTYRNQDIDYIQIKADADGQRSYNYRVVMLSGGAELDMRGRCSAGQKVLACLIIRLALAETFCLHCGILALDEPTTNLDSANAESLAEALRAVMLARREQANFQLIVITHDEAFAHKLGTREHTEYLWRVTKDENQHSRVLQETVLD